MSDDDLTKRVDTLMSKRRGEKRSHSSTNKQLIRFERNGKEIQYNRNGEEISSDVVMEETSASLPPDFPFDDKLGDLTSNLPNDFNHICDDGVIENIKKRSRETDSESGSESESESEDYNDYQKWFDKRCEEQEHEMQEQKTQGEQMHETGDDDPEETPENSRIRKYLLEQAASTLMELSQYRCLGSYNNVFSCVHNYKQHLSAFIIQRNFRNDGSMSRSPRFFNQIHDLLGKIQKSGFHIQQIRPYIEDSDMLSIHFDIPNKLLLAKLRDKLLIMFDKFVINFKSTKFYVPDKDLSIIGLTNPYNSGFKVGEHVKEKFWGKSLENQLNFLFNLDEFTAFVMMKEFFFQHGTMMSTTIADKPRCYMYNNVYWEELTTNLSEIRGNKFDVMYQWLFKEWNLIQKEEFSYLDNAIIDTFQVSSDKDIRMIKSKIDTNIRNLHDGCSRKNPYLHNKDFGVANPSTI